MRKRVLLFTSILCVFACLIFVLPAKTEATEEKFYVGYSRVDINPYIDPTLTGSALVAQSNIMALPLYGSGDVWNRLSTYGLVDDNGDGAITTEDGLKATCIAVTDAKGNTILLITVDMIGALQATRIRDAVMERVNAALASGEVSNVVMDSSHIYYTGTHTHNAPQADAYSSKGRTDFNNAGVDLNVVNTNLGIWIDRTAENIASAAIAALQDRAEATVVKDSVSAADCTDDAVKGKTMNAVRHYVAADQGCVAGDNFNNRGSDPKQVTQVNDVMHLLKFSFADSSKLPIVIANWRGHPSLNNSNSYSQSSSNCISSDFVNAFRRTLETNAIISSDCKIKYASATATCRVAFFQAAGGNVNPRGYEKTNGVAAYKWIDSNAKTLDTSRGNVYGRVLGAMAKNGLTSTAGAVAVAAGEIRTMRYYQNGIRNATGVSALAYEAAKYYQEMVKTGTYVYKSPYTNEIYVIGSKYHANSLISKWNVTTQTPNSSIASMQINTILVGEDLAFVTGSGELFDYYYKENGIFTEENNAWNDLDDPDTYGTPFVLELCNGMNGYVPNYYAYDYNLDSDTWARGSYEAHTTSYPQGTGEQMIRTMRWMLDTLSVSTDGARQQLCEHCGVEVTWYPYDGKTEMVSGGHYYLPEDNHTAQIHVKNGKVLCFDLNGHTLTGDSRAFYTASNGNATLNLMDSSQGKTGVVRGGPGITGASAGYGGGVILVDKGNTFNFYGGTLEYINDDLHTVCSGGVLYVNGTFNMYGGTVRGGCADSFTGQYLSGGSVVSTTREGNGAAICVKGTFRMYGGTVESGKLRLVTGSVGQDALGNDIYTHEITDREGVGECIYAATNSKVILSGNASVENLYLAGGLSADLTIEGNYTGSLELSYPEEMIPELSERIATAEDADVSGAKITFRNLEGLTAAVRGEEVIVSESPYSYLYCEGCQNTVQWTPVTDAQLDLATNTKGMTPGHYILTENVTTTQKQLNPDGKNPGVFCIDLNGYEFHGETRAFYVYDSATLNLQDSRDTGFVQGDKATNMYGGTLYCSGATAVINVYGITVKATPVTVLRGSTVFMVGGTVNLYDARVEGGNAKDYGGTVFCANGAKLKVFGGTITAGSTDGSGSCVFTDVNGKVTLSGDAAVDEIYVFGTAADTVTVDATEEAFTGSTVLCFKTAVTTDGIDVGDIIGDKGMTFGDITQANTGMAIVPDGADLKTAKMAVELVDGEKTRQFSNMEKALAAYTGSGFLRLYADIASDLTVTQNTYLDLCARTVSGSITVAEGATLYCMDSATDDYAVMDETGFGLLSGTLSGNVQPVSEGSVSACESGNDPYRAGYVRVNRPEGASFHRVNLQIHSVSLRPGCVGLYYRCDFKADEVAAEEIYGFGVALSVFAVPDAQNLESACEYSAFDYFESGPQGNGNYATGTLLRSIMRPVNTDAVNDGNAGVPIYGRAYILTESGYTFGTPVSCSLKSLLGGIDEIWNTLSAEKQQGVLDMYDTYRSVMSTWELPNINPPRP